LDKQSIGEHIKDERLRLGLTQKELGKLVGIANQTLCDWEAGRSTPDVITLAKLANICNRYVSYFTDDLPQSKYVDVLGERTETYGEFNEKEKKIIMKIRALPAGRRKGLEMLLGIRE